jgi:hypothetical protein
VFVPDVFFLSAWRPNAELNEASAASSAWAPTVVFLLPVVFALSAL